LGDGTTTTFKRILISTYDGDLSALRGVIESPEADEFVRAGALEVLAYLTATGRIPREETKGYLLQLYDTLEPQHESFVWSGWVMAIELLGLEALSDVVGQAFRRGLIDPMVMDYDHFRQDLGRTLADPTRLVGFQRDKTGPLEDAIGELSSWYAFSDAAKRDRSGEPRALRVFASPWPTRPCPLLTPSRASVETTHAHVVAAISSRSAASIRAAADVQGPADGLKANSSSSTRGCNDA